MSDGRRTISELRAELARLDTRANELEDAPFGSEGHAEQLRIFQAQDGVEAEIAELERRERYVQTSAALGFHWTDGWFFQRQDDGGVRVVRFRPDDDEPEEVMLIDGNSWCSIMCSASGDYGPGRWDEARRFHRVEGSHVSA